MKNVLGIITFDGSKARQFFKIRDKYKLNIRKIATDDEKTQDEKLELYAVEREKFFDNAEKLKVRYLEKLKLLMKLLRKLKQKKQEIVF